MADSVSTAAFRMFETDPEDRQGALAPEKAPTWMWGQGYPDGDLDPWLSMQKGSLWTQVNASDDDTCLWQKVDEGGDDDDWVRFVPQKWSPIHQGDTYNYGFRIDSDDFFTSTAASKNYMLMLGGDRQAAYDATGDSNDAYFRVSGSNYGQCDSNFILRGVNVSVTNRDSATLGHLENFMGVQNKSAGTVSGNLFGCTVIAENYGTAESAVYGMDIISRNEHNGNEGDTGVLRLRNDDRSGQSALDAMIVMDTHSSSGGATTLIDASAVELTEYDSGTAVVLMTFQGADADTFYLVHDTDAATVLSVATSVS